MRFKYPAIPRCEKYWRIVFCRTALPLVWHNLGELGKYGAIKGQQQLVSIRCYLSRAIAEWNVNILITVLDDRFHPLAMDVSLDGGRDEFAVNG